MRPRPSRTLRAAAVLALVVPALVAPGCIAAAIVVGAAAAFGVVKYTENEAYRDFHDPLPAVWSATVASLRENGYPLPHDPLHGPNEGQIEAGDAKVVVERHAEDFTRVRVRIGTFESEDHRRRAALVLDGVASRAQ